MSLLNYTARVPAKSQRVISLPPITSGEMSAAYRYTMPDGYAEKLQNCRYVSSQLILGRGGLELETSHATVHPGSIRHIVGAIVNGTAGIYVSGANGLYKKNGAAYDLIKSDAQIQQLISYNDDLIACATDRVLRWDGSNIYQIGSQTDKITAGTQTTTLDCYLSTPAALPWSVAHSEYKKVLRCSVYMKKATASIAGTVKLTLAGVDSDSVAVDTGVGLAYAIVNFDFSTPVTLNGSTTTDFTMTASDGDSTDKLLIAKDATGAVMLAVNGYEAPAATFGVSHATRLELGNPNTYKIWFSNYNLADDFYTTSADGATTYGGYYAFDDDPSSRCYGIIELYGDMLATGVSKGSAVTTMIDDSHAIAKRYAGGALSWRGFAASPVGAISTNINGLSIGSGTAAYEDISFNVVSNAVREFFVGEMDDTITVFYNPIDHQIWVFSASQSKIRVVHLPEGQWTTYEFTDVLPGFATVADDILYIGDTTGKLYSLQPTANQDNAADINYIIITKMYAPSPFQKTILREFLWDLENGDLSGYVKILSGLNTTDTLISRAADMAYAGDASDYAGDANYPAKGSRAIYPKRVKIKTNGFQFILHSMSKTSAGTNVGGIRVRVSTDGRAIV